MKKISFLFCLLVGFHYITQGQHSHPHTHFDHREIKFPDVPGYHTLVCDLHIHTVFSDGSVWPDIRVQEAQKDGLDAIAVTDHLEYQPHKEDIPNPDRNRAYEVAQEEAGDDDLIIINGSEITRSMPPGHSNAIFISDANRLLDDDPLAVFREARRQEAFIFWNHPDWPRQAEDGIARLTDMHHQLIEDGLLNGIEVVNGLNYSAEALQIAHNHNLTVLGTSDVHGLIDWQYDVPHGGHRSVTLVFAKERSKEGIKDGLFNGRTVVWFNNLLIGKEEFLVPLIRQSLTIKEAFYQENTQILSMKIENHTGVEFLLTNKSDYTFREHSELIKVKPFGVTEIQVKTLKRLSRVNLPFAVNNAVTILQTQPEITFEVSIE